MPMLDKISKADLIQFLSDCTTVTEIGGKHLKLIKNIPLTLYSNIFSTKILNLLITPTDILK